MNKTLKVATVLSWINMIIWGLVCLVLLLGLLASGNMTMTLVLIFLSAIILHSYAAFQLHKSIRNPAIPLSSQTSTGIRFIGFVAMFIGISFIFAAVNGYQHSHDILKQMNDNAKEMGAQFPQMKDFKYTIGQINMLITILLLIGLCIVVNVNLNFRLLRWYFLLRNNDKKEK
jgi:hypothetical protein